MRSLIFSTALLICPGAAFAQSCATPSIGKFAATPEIIPPPPITATGPSVPLTPEETTGPMPNLIRSVANAGAPVSVARSTPQSPGQHNSPGGANAAAPSKIDATDFQSSPALAHIAGSGAVLSDLGTIHGLRSVYAENGGQVMVFEVTPDGQAIVAGLMADLSVEQLKMLGGKNLVELKPLHGLRTFFLRNGPTFQVFYASPDDARVIPGVMWDANGKDITSGQIAAIPGAIPTVTIGEGGATAINTAKGGPSGITTSLNSIQIADRTVHGIAGPHGAPQLWMFIDPQCAFSIRAMQQLMPAIASGRLRLNLIPLSILDGEDQGLSTRSALALLSVPPDRLVSAWEAGETTGAPSVGASAALQRNMAAATAIGLKGTPTLIWQKANGTEGRIDGLPPDMDAVLASMN